MKLLTPMARLALGEQLLERPVGVEREVEAARQRLVQDQQVEKVDAELAGALVERVQRGVVAVVADPDLRLEEHLVAGDARAADAFADLTLVGVGGGRIDVTVAEAQGLLDRGGRDVGRGLEDAEPDGRHLHAVVQNKCLHGLPPRLVLGRPVSRSAEVGSPFERKSRSILKSGVQCFYLAPIVGAVGRGAL
jgi:hypothetical protein